jgi:polysaccharide biosynthesis protein PslG
MRIPPPLRVFIVLSSFPLLSAVAEDGLPRPVVPEGLGVNIHFTHPGPGEMTRFAEAGYRMVRMDFAWGGVEREPGRYDFSAYERLMSHLKQVGARPIFILDYGNRLYDQGESPHTDAARAAFARYAAAAARHFKGQGVIWEIWNEPNISQFWKPEPDASAYARLAVETARAVRVADPGAVIVAPGSSTFPWPFLETVFAAGLLEQIDAVSVHPYRESAPETAGADYGRLRALIARHASPARLSLPIISSEWGYSTAAGAVSESRQAQYLARQWLANLAAGVNLSIFYDWRDDGDNPRDREHRFGTVRRNLEPKPSFLAAQKLIHTLRGYTFRHRLVGSSPSEWKLLFEQAEAPRGQMLVEWSVSPTSPDASQMPGFRAVAPSDSEARPLRRLASIQFRPGPLAEKQGHPATLPVTVVNTEDHTATVHIKASQPSHSSPTLLDLTLQPGERASRSLELADAGLRVDHRTVPLKITWNDEALPAIAPLDIWRADPVSIHEAPRAQGIEVTVENPAREEFLGRLRVLGDGSASEGPAVHVQTGQYQVRLLLPKITKPHQVVLVDDAGKPVAQTTTARFEAMVGFPSGPNPTTDLISILFVDNAPRSRLPLSLGLADAMAPAPFALQVPYHFDPGWRYLGVSFRTDRTILAGATGAMVWVRGNHSGDALRCRFRDATGQTFQPDLGRLDWTDWRPVRIDFTAGSGAGHWGGADDGVPHPPLAWENLLLIDSSRRSHPQPQSILVASPFYLMAAQKR